MTWGPTKLEHPKMSTAPPPNSALKIKLSQWKDTDWWQNVRSENSTANMNTYYLQQKHCVRFAKKHQSRVVFFSKTTPGIYKVDFADGNTHWNNSKSSRSQTVTVILLPNSKQMEMLDVMLREGKQRHAGSPNKTFRSLLYFTDTQRIFQILLNLLK